MRNNQGFTLIEMLIVVAITVTLVTTSFISYQGFKDRKDVELSVSEVSSAIRDARDRSRTQENGSRWSLRLSSFENSPSNYELYSGGSYSTSSVVSSKIIRNPMTFSEPYPDGSIYDMNFEPINGSLSNQKVISITRRSGSSFLGDIIVNKFGRITERIEDGLIGYWHFDEGSGGVVKDATLKNEKGSLVDGPSWESPSDCISSICLSFDGNDDYLEIPDSSVLDSVFGSSNKIFTLSAWIYPTSWTNYSTVFNKAYGGSWSNTTVGLWAYSGGLRCTVGSNVGGNPSGSYVGVTNKPSLNNWYHVACVGDGDNLFMYVDGELVGNTSIPETVDPTSNNDPLTIGRRHDGQNESFPGFMDELRVYDRNLSPEEIKRIYDDLR